MTVLEAIESGPPVSPSRARPPLRRKTTRAVVPLVVLAVLAVLPWVGTTVPLVFTEPVNSAATMGLLATCLTMAGIAVSYDVLFGRTGLLSFGHALFVGVGAYTGVLVINRTDFGFGGALLVTIPVAAVLALVVGAVALRVRGIAFAMVTLAAAQAAVVFVIADPFHVTKGDDGVPLDRAKVPPMLVGLVNAPYRYWVALGFAALAWALVTWLVRSRAGHAWAAVRENEDRVEVLGVSSRIAKLIAFVVGSVIAAVGGIVLVITTGGANVNAMSTDLTLSLLVMVVIGGAGTRYGAVVGAFVYVWLDHRLLDFARADAVQDLPSVLRVPFSQPLFILGLVFVLLVYFAPGGLSRAFSGRRWLPRSSADRPRPSSTSSGQSAIPSPTSAGLRPGGPSTPTTAGRLHAPTGSRAPASSPPNTSD